MEILLPLPIGVPVIAVPALDTIPGSASATPLPSARESPEMQEAEEDGAPIAGPSSSTPFYDARSTFSQESTAGSYFPPATTAAIESIPFPTYSGSPSGTSTPNRIRPAPISIPAATPDEPIFSSYPHTANASTNVSRNASLTKRNFTFPLKQVFSLRDPTPRRRAGVGDGASSGESSGWASLDITAPPSPAFDKPQVVKGRKRASTISHLPSPPPPVDPIPVQARRKSLAFHVSPGKTLRSLSIRKRRRSLGTTFGFSPPKTEFLPTDAEHWPSMPREVAKRLNPEPLQPFAYAQPDSSSYTLQTISTVATVRPLTPSMPSVPIVEPLLSSPTIGQRRSSLVGVALGLSDVPVPPSAPEAEFVVPDEMVMPHAPPPRRSSISLGSESSHELRSLEDSTLSADIQSLLSSSQATSETCAFSPTSTNPHPLSSATTSLSRSAKSGNEPGERDPALSALKLQRSLEWEAKQTRHRRRIEKRKMILLELVETEVAYAEDMRTLVTVYLPQLYALPSISERTADLVARNAKDLMSFHTAFAVRMVEVLRDERIMYEGFEGEDLANKVERVSRRLSELFVQEVEHFAAYNTFCAGSIAASTLVRHIAQRPDFDAYERRCQIICQGQPHVTLKDLLEVSLPSTTSTKNRLHFRDYLIMPIQRICRYPLLLGSLIEAAPTPSPQLELHPIWRQNTDQPLGVDVESALGAMRTVAEEADEARRKKDAEVKSATILERMELHAVITPAFLRRLGVCRLIGSLDVLHHHPTVAPLVPPVKVKYLAAFLYRGYLILAKVKKGKIYEAKHFLPLEVFELIDITEGFLPHSIRLSLREHNFDLAASCEAEKEVWAAALVAAREESTVPPFELPASVSPFAARPRRVSITSPPNELSTMLSASSSMKRHTVLGLPEEAVVPVVAEEVAAQVVSSPDEATPNASPTAVSLGHSDQITAATSILLRRASPAQRQATDRALLDVFSEVCAQARSKAQLQSGLFVPEGGGPGSEVRDRLSMRDSTMLRRRRSFLDVHHRSTSDISFSGEIKGLLIPARAPSAHGSRRMSTRPMVRIRTDDDSSTTATEIAGYETAASVSDFGTLRGRDEMTRTNSQFSFDNSPAPSPRLRRSFNSLRKAAAPSAADPPSPAPVNGHGLLSLNRRKTASTYTLHTRPPAIPSRAKSMPVSPVVTPLEPPPALQQSISETLDPSYFPNDHIDPFTPVGGAETPIWQRNQGTSHVLPETPEEKGGGAWNTLKRNLSFARSRSSGLLGYSADESRVDLAESSEFGSGTDLRSSGSIGSRDKIGQGLDETPPPIDSPPLEHRPSSLLRKRSVRLLRSLGKLTAFETISSSS